MRLIKPQLLLRQIMSTNVNDEELNTGVHDDDVAADLQYGYCRSRRRTSHEHRGSSSLTPAQIVMEQETYYRYAEVAVQHVVYILQLILLHQTLYISLRATILFNECR